MPPGSGIFARCGGIAFAGAPTWAPFGILRPLVEFARFWLALFGPATYSSSRLFDFLMGSLELWESCEVEDCMGACL